MDITVLKILFLWFLVFPSSLLFGMVSSDEPRVMFIEPFRGTTLEVPCEGHILVVYWNDTLTSEQVEQETSRFFYLRKTLDPWKYDTIYPTNEYWPDYHAVAIPYTLDSEHIGIGILESDPETHMVRFVATWGKIKNNKLRGHWQVHGDLQPDFAVIESLNKELLFEKQWRIENTYELELPRYYDNFYVDSATYLHPSNAVHGKLNLSDQRGMIYDTLYLENCKDINFDSIVFHVSGYPYRDIEVLDDPVYGPGAFSNTLYLSHGKEVRFTSDTTVSVLPSSTARKYSHRIVLDYLAVPNTEVRIVGWVADSGSQFNQRIDPAIYSRLEIELQYEEGVGITDPITFIQPLVSPINSVEESAEQLMVYPTPSTEFARVDIPVAFDSYDVRVFDATGREQSIEFWRHDNQSLALDIRALSAGVYYVRVHTNTGTYTTQIVRR